jgi:hypothetical protein
MTAATYDITAAQVGFTLAVNGVLNGLACMNPPPPGAPPPDAPHTGRDRMLTIVDDSRPGQQKTLINFDPFTRPLVRSSLLMSPTYNIPFGNLTVKSCPAGALFRVNTV